MSDKLLSLARKTDDDLAAIAVSVAHESFTLARELNITKRDHLHVVVMSPGVPYVAGRFRDYVLLEVPFGDPNEWEHNYHHVARAKARASWRTGLPTRYIRQCAPHLSRFWDTVYWGSAVLDGIIVGCSGVQAYYDEAMAYTVAAWFRALLTGRDEEQVTGTEDDFFGGIDPEIDGPPLASHFWGGSDDYEDLAKGPIGPGFDGGFDPRS